MIDGGSNAVPERLHVVDLLFNGERVEWRVLTDGDEIVVGRYRLHFLEAVEHPVQTSSEPLEAAG